MVEASSIHRSVVLLPTEGDRLLDQRILDPEIYALAGSTSIYGIIKLSQNTLFFGDFWAKFNNSVSTSVPTLSSIIPFTRQYQP